MPGTAESVNQKFSLRGKKAIVTGGNRGIGLAVVYALAEAGADVAILYRAAGNADEVAQQAAQKTGRTIKAYQCDVIDPGACETVVDAVLGQFGALDIVVINAGVASAVPAEDCPPEIYQSMMEVNTPGAFVSRISLTKCLLISM